VREEERAVDGPGVGGGGGGGRGALGGGGAGGGISVGLRGVRSTACSHVCKASVAHCIPRDISKILMNGCLRGMQYVHQQQHRRDSWGATGSRFQSYSGLKHNPMNMCNKNIPRLSDDLQCHRKHSGGPQTGGCEITPKRSRNRNVGEAAMTTNTSTKENVKNCVFEK
jgi:hypothetical protein